MYDVENDVDFSALEYSEAFLFDWWRHLVLISTPYFGMYWIIDLGLLPHV